MSSKSVKSFRLPLCIRLPPLVAEIHIYSSGMSGCLLTLIYMLLEASRVSRPADFLTQSWNEFCFLFLTWILLFLLGISLEILKHAGWRLIGVLTKREDSPNQKYMPLGIIVVSAQLRFIFGWMARLPPDQDFSTEEKTWTAQTYKRFRTSDNDSVV
jgi:hypothetical protein